MFKRLYNCNEIMFNMANKYADWLNKMMDERGINQSELAKKSGLTRGAISGILSGSFNAGYEAVVKISQGLNVPVRTSLSAAGLLPPVPERTESHEQVLHLWDQLNETDKQVILDMMEVLNTKKR